MPLLLPHGYNRPVPKAAGLPGGVGWGTVGGKRIPDQEELMKAILSEAKAEWQFKDMIVHGHPVPQGEDACRTAP